MYGKEIRCPKTCSKYDNRYSYSIISKLFKIDLSLELGSTVNVVYVTLDQISFKTINYSRVGTYA